jgi:hypothetical protein
MQIKLKYGIDKLLFGMQQNDVIAIYGKPNRNFKDEDDNIIYCYNGLKMRLTFYADEDFKLGYIIASSPNLEWFGQQLIGKTITDVQKDLALHGITKFTRDTLDTYENYFNEDNWIILQTEYNEVVKLEIGAIINLNDEMDWKFGK